MAATTKTLPTVAEAQAALDALEADDNGFPEALRAAIDDGDADRAVELLRRQDEIPLRRRVAEAVLLKARITAAEQAAEAMAPDLERVDAAWQAAEERVRAALAADSRSAVTTAQMERDRAARVSRAAHQAHRDHVSEAARCRKDLADRLNTRATVVDAPVVRSLIHAHRRAV